VQAVYGAETGRWRRNDPFTEPDRNGSSLISTAE
jgi:hypothetical protein